MSTIRSDEAKYRVKANPLMDWVLKKALLQRHPLLMRFRSIVTRDTLQQNATVSIIIPMHNVRPFIRATLDSIRYQKYFNVEVVLIDDGSTDGTAEIAQEFVDADDRYTLLQGKQSGPGAARNTALRASTGKYIAFVDADDILPVGAIHRMVRSLEQSGSNLAVGAYEHLRGADRWRSAWVNEVHATNQQGVTLSDVPGITRNVFLWNKLFRRDFFEKEIQSIPEGIVYEDQLPTARAFTSAKSIDVLPETVYFWRKRHTQDSITQNRGDIEHLRNRFAVLTEINDIYEKYPDKAVYMEWLKKTLFQDMLPFFEVSSGTSSVFKEERAEMCKWILDKITKFEN